MEAGKAAWYATWPILYEFMRVTTHARVLSPAWTARQAWAFVESLLASPGFGVMLPTTLMREHGIRAIQTLDTDLHRFPWVEVLDPTVRPRRTR